MDLALSIADVLRQIYELRDAIHRQRHVNRHTYLRMMEIYVELLSSEGVQANATLRRTAALDKFSVAVTKFLLYLKKYHDMHRVVRLFKLSTMEEQRLEIVDEIDQLYRMINLATAVAAMDGAAAASSNAAKLVAKLEDMHGDIRLTHDQVLAALLANKQRARKQPPAENTSAGREDVNPNLVDQVPSLMIHERHDQCGMDHAASQLQQPRQKETRQRRDEIVAAWGNMSAPESYGDASDTRDAPDTSKDALGSQFLEALRTEERYSKNAVAINFLRRGLEKKLGTYNSESRLLMRWVHTGHLIRVIRCAIESAVGILEFTSTKSEWLEAFQAERSHRAIFYREVLADSGWLMLEMGDHRRARELYTVLLYSREKYPNELDASEREITMSLIMQLEKLAVNSEAISLPSWFAVSESEWSFAERIMLPGDEASCVQQIEICKQLNHPNVCKFYGGYHVGRAPFVILEETVALKSRLIFEAEDVWRLLLDYANGLQYILSRGLAYTSLSLADFRATWDGKPVLSSIGLARYAIDDPDDINVKQHAASNVFAFGLIGFQVLALKYLPIEAVRKSSEDDPHSFLYVQELSNEWLRVMRKHDWPARVEISAVGGAISADIMWVAKIMTEDEWSLLCGLSKVTSVNRTDIAKYISRINGLAQARPVVTAPAKVLKSLNEVTCSSSGRKLKEILDEIESELDEVDAQFRDDNRRVVDRLLDIYLQMHNSIEPLLASVVHDFVGLVQSYHIQVSRRLENIEFSGRDVMMTSVALTVADRNESMHHLLDEIIWNSGCLTGRCAVHQWREHCRKQARLRPQKAMQTVPEIVETDDTCGATHIACPRWLLPTDEVQIIKRIAHGSYGAAYWGKWLDTDVVVKKVLTNQHEKRNREQFQREVELWFSLNHANLIKLYGACQEIDKQPVFVCERAINGTLSSFLKGKSRADIWSALYTAAQGLRHLHERGIVHGDLKGNNVLVCDNDLIKLADFGLSALVEPVRTPVDKPGSIGAIRWRAPECIQGFKPTFASDIYSFGMCIVEAVTGEFPWGSMPDPSVVRHVVSKKTLPARLDTFHRDEREMVRLMCQYNPNDRIDVGAVVCLLYQLNSGAHRSADQDVGYNMAVVMERFMALRRRENLFTGVEELPEWFICADQVELACHLSNGDFAQVSKAHWADADVAMKSLRTNDEVREQFRRQVQIWSVLNHPNIVHLYGACPVGSPFYVCEMAGNGDLAHYRKGKNRQEAWRCLLDAAVGLQYLHARGVIHGNLKSNAFLLFDRGITKVGSFGLSVFADSNDIYDGVFGAYQWKAPEVLDGGKPTIAADIYSFGMCVIEALTGAVPWGNVMEDVVIKYRVKRGELPSRPAEMNDREWELVRRMCRFDPNSRISIDAVVCYINSVIAT